ncbi:MAG: 50S ribosomal protein L24 [Leptospiraceae bacterium]|nr:50S ribosomal protein L24 [Leptospiraceae bacterium]MCP5496650.1 50S ribosomal protein L24 [Leptospiraceae bacterium]
MKSKLSDKNIQPVKFKKVFLKRDDEVVCIAGKDKGKRGKILALDKKKGKVVVSGVNKRKKFLRPTQENPRGGEIEIESPIHISNVMYFDSKTKKGVRLSFRDLNGKKVRVIKKDNREV